MTAIVHNSKLVVDTRNATRHVKQQQESGALLNRCRCSAVHRGGHHRRRGFHRWRSEARRYKLIRTALTALTLQKLRRLIFACTDEQGEFVVSYMGR